MEKQKKQELLNDISKTIENYLLALLEANNDNYYEFYTNYLSKKYEIIENILNHIKSLKVEELKEMSTSQGWELKKVLVSKYNINANNEYQTNALIEELLRKKVKDMVKEEQENERIKEKLANKYNQEENESPSIKKQPFTIMGVSPLKFIFGIFIAICEVFGDTKKWK